MKQSENILTEKLLTDDNNYSSIKHEDQSSKLHPESSLSRDPVNIFNKIFYISVASHLILVPFSDVFYIQWLNSFIKYPWIFNVLFMPFANVFFFGLIVTYYYIKEKLPKESIGISRSVIIKLALMNLSSNYFFIVSIPNISTLLYIILNKFSLFFLMILSYFYLQRRYYITHYIGVFITLCGVSLSIFLTYRDNKNQSSNNSSALNIILFIIGIFINNISHVIKEKYIKTCKKLNIFWLYFWVNIYQIIFGILTIPIIFIPNTKYYVRVDNLSAYFADAFKTQYFNEFPLLWMFLTEITCCGLALFEFNIVKFGSYVEFNIIHAFTVPLITLLNYIFMKYNLLYYPDKEKFEFKNEDYISLCFVIVGSIIYFWKKEFTADPESGDAGWSLRKTPDEKSLINNSKDNIESETKTSLV